MKVAPQRGVTTTCTHPIREGLGYSDNFEIVGSYATDAWGRCKKCGVWWWCVIDDGKFQFEDQRAVPTEDAEPALLRHDPDALARLFVSRELPHGPVWELASARIEIFRALTPSATDAERARAIRAATPDERWQLVAQTLEQDAGPRAPDRVLAFDVDLRVDGVVFREWFEVGEALVLLTQRPELLRLDRAGLVQLPLAAEPQVLARGEDRVALAVADGLVILDAAGCATSWPLSEHFDVSLLDGGWWLFVQRTDEPDRWIELHAPDGRARVKFRRRFARATTWMPPPRRFAGGWIISNLIDDEGHPQALTLFDGDFKVIAQSVGVTGERQVTPIDDGSFWASTDGAMERWVRRDRVLERAQQLDAGSSWIVGDVLVTDTRRGDVIGRGPDGGFRWTWHRAPVGATYGVAAPGGVLLYDDACAHVLDASGIVRTSFRVESADVRAGTAGTIYVKTGAELWIVADNDARAIVVGTEAHLETTCGDDALLRSDGGKCTVVGRSDIRGTFAAKDAVFSVIGTRGIWVVEGDRIRGIAPAFGPTTPRSFRTTGS
ncbi:MAG TPA: hypothetical protein VFQ65_15745 [Kofleriaceae bacterium]|nr:hypothetical protein [Kofleriaceae bacterium]